MELNGIFVFSVHDRTGPILAVGLGDLVTLIASRLQPLVWRVDCQEYLLRAGEGPALHRGLAGEYLAWHSTAELMKFADTVAQVIDGAFIAFPSDNPSPSLSALDLQLARFPDSKALVVIRAVDSSFYEVYCKDAAILDVVRGRYTAVQVHNPADFFAE